MYCRNILEFLMRSNLKYGTLIKKNRPKIYYMTNWIHSLSGRCSNTLLSFPNASFGNFFLSTTTVLARNEPFWEKT